MSAGAGLVLPTGAVVLDSLDFLAPRFRLALQAALAECDRLGLDAVVYETYRTKALAEVYYARGRTVKPPDAPVTNARDNVHSWHGFGLAADVIHRTKLWNADAHWWHQMGAVFKSQGCAWGGDWDRFKDLPHVQWSRCNPSPDDSDRTLLLNGGTTAVWEKWGAL